MCASQSVNAADFVNRFVQCYWSDIANGAPEFEDHTEPCTETLEQLLEAATVDWHQNTPEHLVIVMSNYPGDGWRFTFNRNGPFWEIRSATAGALPAIDRVDMLDNFYAPHFLPFFERIIRNAQTNT